MAEQPDIEAPLSVTQKVMEYVAWRLSKVKPEAWNKDTTLFMTTEFKSPFRDFPVGPFPDPKPPPVPPPTVVQNLERVLGALLNNTM